MHAWGRISSLVVVVAAAAAPEKEEVVVVFTHKIKIWYALLKLRVYRLSKES